PHGPTSPLRSSCGPARPRSPSPPDAAGNPSCSLALAPLPDILKRMNDVAMRPSQVGRAAFLPPVIGTSPSYNGAHHESSPLDRVAGRGPGPDGAAGVQRKIGGSRRESIRQVHA